MPFFDQSVSDALVVSLAVIVLHVLVDDVSEMPATEEDHPIETFRLDRSDEAFSEGIQVRALGREFDATNTSGVESVRELLRVQRIPIVDEIALSDY